jgi:7-carboxy-7-deazaguanine synthase
MLKVNSIFESISGEAGGFAQGTWCTFIRLQGCNLNCKWCDTLYARDPANGLYTEMSIEDIIKKIKHPASAKILVTGGEPLYQQETIDLINQLILHGCKVQVETNGTIRLPQISGVHWVVDCKPPSSGMCYADAIQTAFNLMAVCSNNWSLDPAANQVYLKFVVQDMVDLDFALKVMTELVYLRFMVSFILSPIDGSGKLLDEILKAVPEDIKNYLIFSVQLHKIFKLP